MITTWSSYHLVRSYQPRPGDAPKEQFARRVEACRGCALRRINVCSKAGEIVSVMARQVATCCPEIRWASDFLHRHGANEARTRDAERSMELREERLHGRPDQTRAGEVDVRKEVVTERQSVDVPVEREEVIIERRPSSGRPSSGRPVGEYEEIRVPVREEHARVEKDTVSRGEANVKKQTRHDTERVSGDVRKEQAKVEKRGDANVRERR